MLKKTKILVMAVSLIVLCGLVWTPMMSATTLVVWESSDYEENYVKKMGELYFKETGIKVEVYPVDQLQQSDKLALDGPAGKGADIVAWPHDKIGQTVEQGLLWEIPEDKVNLEDYTDAAVQAMRYKGDLYGIPYAMESLALIYNKDLYLQVPETFDELIEVALEIHDPSKNKYGFMFNMEDFYFAYGFFGGYGAYVFKETDGGLDTDDIGLANKGAIQAAEYLKSLRDLGLIPEGTTQEVIDGLFIEGNLAFQINGPWNYPLYEKSNINYGVVPMPKLSNGQYPQTFIGVKGYYVSAFSEHQEEALDFIKWLTSKENSYEHYLSTSIIPARDDVAEMPEFLDNESFGAFALQASRGVPMPNVPEMMQVWDPAADAINFILKGQVPVESVLPLSVEQIKENIRMMKQ